MKETEQVLNMLVEGKITVNEATRLLDSLNQSSDTVRQISVDADQLHHTGALKPKKQPSFLRVIIKEGETEKVVVRVPLKLVRLGQSFSSFMPDGVKEAIEGQGINFSELSELSDEEFMEAFADLQVDIEDKDTTVRVFCE